MPSFADDFDHPLLRKEVPAWGWAGRIRHPWQCRGCTWNERTKSFPRENSCNVYHTSIYNWHSGSDVQGYSNNNGDTSSASWSNRRWSAFMERTRKPSEQENRSQNWCASPVITSANPNSSPPIFHFSNSARLWVCRLNACANHVSCTEEPLARSVEESCTAGATWQYAQLALC